MSEIGEEKRKFPLHIQNSLLEQVEMLEDDAHVKSKNAFIIKAVEFYIGYLNQQKSLDFISPVLASAIKSEIKSVEINLCEMIFKLAVEQGMSNNILAAAYKISDDRIDALRKSCSNKIAKNNGIITLESANKFQNSDDIEDDYSGYGDDY